MRSSCISATNKMKRFNETTEVVGGTVCVLVVLVLMMLVLGL